MPQTIITFGIATCLIGHFLLSFLIGFAMLEKELYQPFYLHYSATKTENGQNYRLFAPVSAYTLSEDETDARPCETAAGLNLCSVDLVKSRYLACPRKYPFGTKFLIAGEVWECVDRTSQKYDGRFDLLMPTKEMAFEWGVRTIEITEL